MVEHKRFTIPPQYYGKGAGVVYILNQNLLSSLLTPAQTIISIKTASSLLDFLILCYEGKEVEPWTVFEIIPEEIQTL